MAKVESFGFDEVLRKLGSQRSQKPQFDTRVLRELTVIAEETCNAARDTYHSRDSGGYDDHTHNLRGSMGFKIFFESKEVTSGGFDGRGSADGESAARTALSKFEAKGSLWEVVVVAGMEYARYVEAKGCNVISFLQSSLDKKIKKLIQDINDNKI